MKVKDLRELSLEELYEKFKEAKVELFNLHFQLATGQLDNPMKIRDARRTIARIQTVMRERELKLEESG